MNIPILIVHQGNTFYLGLVLKQIKLFNPDSRICLISDESTKSYDFVEHHDINIYSEGMRSFARVYKHLSSNPYNYELFCFQRWFIINEFVRTNKIENFLCMDSDVLLYCNVNDIFGDYVGYDFTICGGGVPGSSLFNIHSINNFCEYIMTMYTTEAYLVEMNRINENRIKEKQLGGICDMTAFVWYQENVKCNVLDIAQPKNGTCFDGCITWPSGFEMKDGKKKVYWIDNLPYGKLESDQSLVRFYCLHFQGRSKYSIYKYLLDENKVHHSGFWYDLKWMFSKDILGARLKGIRKAIHNPQIVVNFIRAKLR